MRANRAPCSPICSGFIADSFLVVEAATASSAPWAMPRGAPTSEKGWATGKGMPKMGELAWSFAPGEVPRIMSPVGQLWASGMKASAMRIERLPVPRMPAVNQSSTISTSFIETSRKRGSGGPSPRSTAAPTTTQSE